MNSICRFAILLATVALAGCVGYGYPGSYGYPGDYGYPSGGTGYPDYGYPDYGYPDSGYYGNRFRCESQDDRTRHCRADTRGGVRIVRQLSDSPCVRGRSWGYDDSGVWVSRGCRAEFMTGAGGGYDPGYGGGTGYGNIVRCESRDDRTRRCAANTRGGVRLVRQLSDSPCVRGRSWGYDNSGIWVSRGCRAEFATGAGGGYDPGYGGGTGYGRTVRCESRDNRSQRCNVRVTRGVDLIRQLSDTRCVHGQNWGWDRSGIWVRGGCRGEFSVR